MGETQNAYDIKAKLDSKDTTNKDLQNLFNQINDLKDLNSSNDAIDNVFDANNQLNKSLKTALEGFKTKDIGTLVTELWKIESDGSNLNNKVKDSIAKLKNLLQDILNEKQVNPASLNEFEWYIRDGKLNNLNKLNSKEIGEIVKFIEDGGLNYDNAVQLYRNMDEQMRAHLSDRNFKKTDRSNFQAVMDALWKAYSSLSKPQTAVDAVREHDLDKIFSEKTPWYLEWLFNLYIKKSNDESWSGKPLDNNSSFNDNASKDNLSFTATQFVEKFNEANKGRIDWAKEKWLKFVNDANNHNKINFDNNWKINLDESNDFKTAMLADIVNTSEINSDHFSDVRKAWKDGYDAAVEAEAKKGWKNIEKNSKEFGKQTETWIKEINGFLKENDQQFLKIEGADSNTTISYNLEKAKIYLESLLKVDGQDATRNNFRTKTGPERKAWIAAVQIALNNLTGVTDENKIKVDGIDQQQTESAVKKFQTDKDLESKDGKPWPETIKLLLDALNHSSTSPESIDTNNMKDTINTIGYKNIGFPGTQEEYGVNGDGYMQFYQKENDTRNILCQTNDNQLFMLSLDTPRIKTKYEITESHDNHSELTPGEPQLNVCAAWAKALNNIISSSDNTDLKNSQLSFQERSGSYQLLRNNVTIPIPNGFFDKEFCWLTKMEDKLKLFLLENNVIQIKTNSNFDQSFDLIQIQLLSNYSNLIPSWIARDQFKTAFNFT